MPGLFNRSYNMDDQELELMQPFAYELDPDLWREQEESDNGK